MYGVKTKICSKYRKNLCCKTLTPYDKKKFLITRFELYTLYNTIYQECIIQ